MDATQNQIFKVQRPLASSGPLESAPFLVYNKDKSVMFHHDDKSNLLWAMMGTDEKLYFCGHFPKEGGLFLKQYPISHPGW